MVWSDIALARIHVYGNTSANGLLHLTWNIILLYHNTEIYIISFVFFFLGRGGGIVVNIFPIEQLWPLLVYFFFNFTRKWYLTSTHPNIYQYFTGANLIRNINKMYIIFYSYIIYVIIVLVLLKLFTSLLPTSILH